MDQERTPRIKTVPWLGLAVTSHATPGAPQAWQRRDDPPPCPHPDTPVGKHFVLVLSHSVRNFIMPAPRNSYSWLWELLSFVTKHIAY